MTSNSLALYMGVGFIIYTFSLQIRQWRMRSGDREGWSYLLGLVWVFGETDIYKEIAAAIGEPCRLEQLLRAAIQQGLPLDQFHISRWSSKNKNDMCSIARTYDRGTWGRLTKAPPWSFMIRLRYEGKPVFAYYLG